MDISTKHEFRIRDLPTRSVTLFPSRAQVVREIKDVPLQPGANQITIVGLTPTVDEHSVKVEGSGSAIITDIAVELLPNREIFQDVFSDADEDDKDDDEQDSDSESDSETAEGVKLASIRSRLTALRDDQKRAEEAIASAESRLKMLDGYGQTLDRKRGVDIAKEVQTYRRERDAIFQDHMAGTGKERTLSKNIADLAKEEQHLLKLRQKEEAVKAKAKANAQKARRKEKAKKARRDAEKAKEKERVRRERELFWPRSCYTVGITLDAPTFTPMSSRRNSIGSVVDLAKPPGGEEESGQEGQEGQRQVTCDLTLSYVTSSAFWSPSYDLALSTTSGTAALCFDAKLTNMTSETWASTKITLSTSETTFRGLGDDIPVLLPWRLKLAGKNSGGSLINVTESPEEQNHKRKWQARQHHQQRGGLPTRGHLFGVDAERPMHLQGGFTRASLPPPPLAPMPVAAQSHQAVQGGGLFGAGAFGASASHTAPGAQYSAPAALYGGRGGVTATESVEQAGGGGYTALDYGVGSSSTAQGPADMDGATIRPEAAPELSFQESAFEESGLTTTYDVPGTKLLTPRSMAAKQRVARISFSGVAFSHVVVAKYKPVAFLKAKLRNSSKLTLLPGPVGLTLDGAFLGRSSLPRCSAGDLFTLSLGVDPAIKVVYAKPEVRRTTTGLFSNQDSSTYMRTITLANTRASAGKPVNVLVLDQAPVSEDEKLRVELQQPRGLVLGGNGVVAGVGGRDGKDEKEWGKATALLNKGGEVVWNVSLNAGKNVKLPLAYEVVLPAGEQAMPC